MANAFAQIFSFAPFLMRIPPFSFVNKRIMDGVNAGKGDFFVILLFIVCLHLFATFLFCDI